MKNYWLEKAEAKAMTMEQKIENMLAPHHVIWLGDDTVGADAPHKMNPIPDHIVIDGMSIPSQITITMPQMSEWDSNTTITSGATITNTAGVQMMTSEPNPHSDLCYCFDINAFNAEIVKELEKAIDNEFAVLVESEGWNLDL